MFKKVLATIMLAATILLVGAQENKAEAYWGLVVNCNEWITLRSYRSTEADTLDRIPKGEWVWIYENSYANGFVKARYEGQVGYVLKAYIQYIKD